MADARSIIVDKTGKPEYHNPAHEDEADEEQPVSTAPAETPESDDQDTVPEKYRGKSVAEIIAMHQNAERALGAKNDELGQWRQLATERRELEREQNLGATSADEDVDFDLTTDALIDDPKGAVSRVVKSVLREELAPLRSKIDEIDLDAEEAEFTQRHSDAVAVTNSPEFLDWVGRSTYRRAAAGRAAKGDFSAATQLLDEFKADNVRPEPTPAQSQKPAPKRDNLAAARAAATESGGTSAPVSTKPSYTADEITRMIATDFQRYSSPAFQAELMSAIAEGRVSGL